MVSIIGQGMAGTPPAPGGPQRLGGRGRSPLEPVGVDEIFTDDVVTAQRDTPVRTVAAKMAEEDVGSVGVVDDGRPIGVVTDRSIALALERTPDLSDQSAETLLRGDVVTADTSMSILDVLDLMSDEGIRRIPVVGDDGQLRGIVTLDDALVHLGSVRSHIVKTVQSQSPRL